MEIGKILKDYVSDITSVEEIMKIEGHKRNPQQNWQQALYKTGTIKEHDLEYDFHGRGCWVKMER